MPVVTDRHRQVLALLALLLASLAAFAPSLGAGFTYDDFPVVLGDPAVTSPRLADTFAEGWHARPLRALTLRLDRALFGEAPAGYHLHSVLWHAACVLLLHRFLLRLGAGPAGAFLGALLFAWHPVHVEAVANVSNRKEPLCLAFSLLSCLAWVRALEARGLRRGLWAGASVAGLWAALLAKQVAVALPLALLAYEACCVPRERRLLLARPRLLAAGALAGAALLAFEVARTVDLGALEASHSLKGWSGELSIEAVVLSSARAFWRHAQLLVLPIGQCPDHTLALSRSLAEPATALAWVALAALVAFSLALTRRAPLAAFGLLWMLVHWLPVSNLVPTAFLVAERYLYVPSVGLSVLVAWAVPALAAALPGPGAHRAAAALAALFLVALGLTTARTASRWHGGETLWAWALECNPASHRAHTEIGNQRKAAGDLDAALAHYSRAIELGFGGALYNRANTFVALGRFEEAVRDYDRAVAFAPGMVQIQRNRADARLALGDAAGALADLDHALAREPEHAGTRLSRGAALLTLGRLAEAEAELERAIALEPGLAAAHYNLGLARLRRGDREGARASLGVALGLGVEAARQALGLLDGQGAAAPAAAQPSSRSRRNG
jgi:tetratricopeptide (TPR) repeat protein